MNNSAQVAAYKNAVWNLEHVTVPTMVKKASRLRSEADQIESKANEYLLSIGKAPQETEKSAAQIAIESTRRSAFLASEAQKQQLAKRDFNQSILNMKKTK